MVLLAWLFALASGIANACLLETRQTHSHIGTDSSFEAAAQAPVILPGHTGTLSDGVGEQHSKAPWAAAGFVDTLLRCEDETGDGYGKETAIQPGIQA